MKSLSAILGGTGIGIFMWVFFISIFGPYVSPESMQFFGMLFSFIAAGVLIFYEFLMWVGYMPRRKVSMWSRLKAIAVGAKSGLWEIYKETRIMLAVFLWTANALVGGMIYAGVAFGVDQEVEEEEAGLVFTKLTETLYSLVGTVKPGDCEKIVPLLPKGKFTVILESPGGSLEDGICLSSHLFLRDVVTVIRDTPVLNEDGVVIYKPDYDDDGMVQCASACSLFFLAGDVRYLVGDVMLGIHGPGISEGTGMKPQAAYSMGVNSAARLMLLIKEWNVVSDEVRGLFIQIPSSSMLWLHPKYFSELPDLISLATHYVDFYGFSAENPYAGLQ